MIESVDDIHIPQLFYILTHLFTVWHFSEKNKIKFNEDKMPDGLNILQPAEALTLSSDADPESVQYLFDFSDALALLGMCNKDKCTRQQSIMLMIEVGKLRRLVIPGGQVG